MIRAEHLDAEHMYSAINTREIVPRLKTIESVAVIPRVASTNLIARRIVNECVENELSLPHAIIIAGEQFAGRGRNLRQWSSPRGKGIYATTMISRPLHELPVIPLAMANIVASYLRQSFQIDARIKWPNDILVDGRKIAGILTEARIQEERVFLIIGTGVNVDPVEDESRPNAIAITESSPRGFTGIESATLAFIEHVDERLTGPLDQPRVLDEWRTYSAHREGDAVECIVHDRHVRGTWGGIDDHGRALIATEAGEVAISAGDLILASDRP